MLKLPMASHTIVITLHFKRKNTQARPLRLSRPSAVLGSLCYITFNYYYYYYYYYCCQVSSRDVGCSQARSRSDKLTDSFPCRNPIVCQFFFPNTPPAFRHSGVRRAWYIVRHFTKTRLFKVTKCVTICLPPMWCDLETLSTLSW